MAYTVVDYGSETPETVDRFGTEQDYVVDGRNGGQRVRHRVTPVRSAMLEDVPSRPARRFWWSVNRYTRSRHYAIRTHTERRLDVHVDAGGHLVVMLDGVTIHDDAPPRRPRN